MNEPIRELPLPNGLSVSVYNHTSRYFGDYFRVRVEIVCRIPLRADYFMADEEFADARAQLGDEVVYTRTEEQMGVPSADIDRVLDRLVANFTEHSLRYVSSAQFPGKVVRSELHNITRKRARTPVF